MSRNTKFFVDFVNKLNFAELFISLSVFLNICLIISAVIASSYYGLVVIGTDIDHGCDVSLFGVGRHCFSDYWTTNLFASKPNPWADVPWNYPAVSMLPTYFFELVGKLFQNPQVGLVLYLGAMAIGTIIPSVWASKGKKLYLKMLILSVTGIVTVPAIMAIDRGNTVGFIVVPTFLFLLGIDRNNQWVSALGLVLLIAIKPQFGLLLLVPLLLGRWRVIAISVLGELLLQISAFALWPKDFPSTIAQSIFNSLSYGQSIDLAQNIPISNSSIISSLFAWVTWDQKALEVSDIAMKIQTNQGLFTFTILGILIFVSFLFRKQLSPVILAILLISMSALWVPLSWGYYLVFAIPIGSILIRDPKETKLDRMNLKGIGERSEFNSIPERISFAILVFTVAISLSQVIVPNIELLPTPHPWKSGQFVTMFWVLTYAFFLVAWGIKNRKSKEKKSA